MKAIKRMACDKQAISTSNSLPYDTEARTSPLLRLPLELRRMIYSMSIHASRCPTPEEVHERNFGAIWEDVPSPLLAVNKQVRDEVFGALQKTAFTMRVTSYGASFDMLGLSCFIAQRRPKSYSGLPKLIIEIWPPHPDRPIEMYNIICHLKDLRNKLRATSVGIASLVIWFRENRIAKWTRDDGRARFDLNPHAENENDPRSSDIGKVLYQFACVTNLTKAQICLPPSLNRCDKDDEVRRQAMNVLDAMEGRSVLADELHHIRSDYGTSDLIEWCMKVNTAQKAKAKLDAITSNGSHKMSEAEWLAFTEVWPHFEVLAEWDDGGASKGEWHYRS